MINRVYLDTCAVNRLTDDRSQLRTQRESEAVAHVLELVAEAQLEWVSSSVLRVELSRNPYPLKRIASLEVLSTATEFIEPTLATLLLAQKLAKHGFGATDAVHFATAEQGQANYLLTTDDQFLRRAARFAHGLSVIVVNPVDWLLRRQ